MKGDLTLKVLEKVGEAAIDMTTLFAATMISPYGASSGKIVRKQRELQNAIEEEMLRHKEQLRFSKLISKMKTEG